MGQQQRQRQQQQAGDDPAAVGADSGAASALDDSLAQHFTSIQELSDRQALEELLPRLQEVVSQVRAVMR